MTAMEYPGIKQGEPITVRQALALKWLHKKEKVTTARSRVENLVRLVLHIVGFSSFTIAGFSVSSVAGFVVLGFCSLLLSWLRPFGPNRTADTDDTSNPQRT